MAPPLISSLGGASTKGFGQGAGGAKAVPAGLIVPLYNTTTVPDGWTAFTSADNLDIVGAGSTYSVGDTGTASGSVSVSGTTTSAGAHANGGTCGCSQGVYDAFKPCRTSGTSGAHTHTFSGSIPTSGAAYKTFKLIKADEDMGTLPANAMLFSTSDLSSAGLSNVESSSDALLRAGSSYGSTGGSFTGTATLTFSTAGSHNHGSPIGVCDADWSGQRNAATAGDHNHSGAGASYTLSPKRAYLSAWTNTSAEIELTGGEIAMYEGTEAPDGWLLCNGSDGTIDLRDRYCHIGTTVNHGTTSGDNTCAYDMSSMGGSATHTHDSGYYSQLKNGGGNHYSISWTHYHSASPSTGSSTNTEPYYALTFIQKAA